MINSGTYNSWGTNRTYGDCSQFTDVDTFSDAFKAQLRQMMTAYWGELSCFFSPMLISLTFPITVDATSNTQFWTWKVGKSSITGKVPNPLWSYQLGLQENYIPRDPRPQAYQGACAALAKSLSLGGQTFVSWTPPLQSYMTGGAGAGNIPASATAAYSFPPASLTNIPQATNLPRLTATGSPITLSPAAPFSSATDTGGWANPLDTAPWLVTVSGCNYLNAYSGVGANPPSSRCTGGARAGSIGPIPVPSATGAPLMSSVPSATALASATPSLVPTQVVLSAIPSF